MSKAIDMSISSNCLPMPSYLDLVKDDEVDLIYIATINSLHYEHMRLCIEHKKNILVEKPFTLNYSEAIERLRKGLADLIFINIKDGEEENLKDIKVKDFCEVQDILVANKDFNNIPNKINILDLNNYPISNKNN